MFLCLALLVVQQQHHASVKSFEAINQSSVTNSATAHLGSSDAALWQAFKNGERDAFDSLYRMYIPLLISYGYKLTNNRSLIQDCIQDLFVELWNNRANKTQVQSIKYYLLKSLRYKLVRCLQVDINEPLEEGNLPPDSINFENELLQKETNKQQSQQLNRVLNELPKRQKEAIYLRYYEEMSNEEVAQVMGVNYQSACKFIYTGLTTLRKKLQLSAIIPLLLPFLEFIKKFF